MKKYFILSLFAVGALSVNIDAQPMTEPCPKAEAEVRRLIDAVRNQQTIVQSDLEELEEVPFTPKI